MKMLSGYIQGAALQRRSMAADVSRGNAKFQIESSARSQCIVGSADLGKGALSYRLEQMGTFGGSRQRMDRLRP
jgi:hypothetical protein